MRFKDIKVGDWLMRTRLTNHECIKGVHYQVRKLDAHREELDFETLPDFGYSPRNFERVIPSVPSTTNPQAFKADAGKPRWSLLMSGCASALLAVVRVLTFAVKPVTDGGKGYVPNSWKEVPNATERYKDALHRHLNKIELGELRDDESGELHWAHVATNALFLAELNKDAPDASSK